jgi:hypothetical protein
LGSIWIFGDFWSDERNAIFWWQDSHISGNQGSSGSEFLTQNPIFLTTVLVSSAVCYTRFDVSNAPFFSYSVIYIPWLILVNIVDHFPYQILKILLCIGGVYLLWGKILIYIYIYIYLIRNIYIPASGWPSGKERVLEIERGSTRSQSLVNSLWKRLWNCRETDYSVMNFKLVLQILDFLSLFCKTMRMAWLVLHCINILRKSVLFLNITWIIYASP